MLENVRVVRHLRQKQFNPFCDKSTYDNLGGATIVFDLDYVNRTVSVSLAIASEDENFVKKEGIRIAVANGVQRSINLDAFQKSADEFNGFVDAYWHVLHASELLNVPLSKREKLFLKRMPDRMWQRKINKQSI